MTQKTKDWTTRTPLKVYQPWHRKLKIEPHDPSKNLPTGRYTFSGVRVAQSLVFCVKVGRLLVGFVLPWHSKLKIEPHEPHYKLPTLTQKTKDWSSRTPLQIYQPWHRKLKIEPHDPSKNLPTMTQKAKDWATRTPLKVYKPWHRKLRIEGW
jgi:hypothetical protein